MSIVEFDGPPSWSLDASETEKRTKCPLGGVVEGKAGGKNIFPHAINPTATIHGHFVPSPVLLASRDQDGGPSNPTSDIYDLREK